MCKLSCQPLEVPKREKQESRGCNPWSGQGEPPPRRKLGDFGFTKSDFKPFHASFKCNNQT